MKTIMIVDDSAIVLSLHTYIVENAGYKVVTAENGFVALEKLMLEKADLIITDINMPRLDGFELIRRIRALPDYRATPIIIITTQEAARDKEKGFQAGANVYVVKPAAPASLVQNVRMLMGDRG